MPRKAKSDEEKLLEQQVRDLITSIKSKDATPTIDLPRAIRLFESAQNSITKALAILRGEEVENPNGVGRPRKEQGETTDSDAPGEVSEPSVSKRTSKRKGVATAAENA